MWIESEAGRFGQPTLPPQRESSGDASVGVPPEKHIPSEAMLWIESEAGRFGQSTLPPQHAAAGDASVGAPCEKHISSEAMLWIESEAGRFGSSALSLQQATDDGASVGVPTALRLPQRNRTVVSGSSPREAPPEKHIPSQRQSCGSNLKPAVSDNQPYRRSRQLPAMPPSGCHTRSTCHQMRCCGLNPRPAALRRQPYRHSNQLPLQLRRWRTTR